MSRPPARTIDDYLAPLPPDKRAALQWLRRHIKAPMHARVFELQPDPDQPGTQRFTDRWYGGRGLGWLQLGDRDDAGLVSVDALAEVHSLLLAADETLLRYFLPLDRREAWVPDWLKFLLPSADRRIFNDQRLIRFEEGYRAHYSGICAVLAFDRSTDTVYYARRARPGLCRLPAPDGRKDGAR